MMEILNLLNKEFNNKYERLRVLGVDYNTLLSCAEVCFLHPNDLELSSNEKKEITNFVISTLQVGCNVKVKFKKSYLDKELIQKFLLNYFKDTLPSMFVYYKQDSVEVNINEDQVEIVLYLIKELYDYFFNNNLKFKLIEALDRNFIGSFSIKACQSNKQIDESALVDHEKQIYENIPKPKNVARYLVYEPEVIFGKEITPMPEQIIDQEESKLSVILAGKVENLVEKTYISRRSKKKGSEEPSYYYKFTLTDHTKSISAIYFSTKANLPKIRKIKDGDKILVIGDIKKTERDTTLYIRSLSLCEIINPQVIVDEKVEIQHDVHIDKYQLIKPKPYIENKQANLFDTVAKYNDFIMNNTFVVFDCETTGLDSRFDEIIEIGAVKLDKGVITEQFQTLVYTSKELEEKIVDITSITQEMLQDAPKCDVVIQDFYKFCEGSILSGYNVLFDVGFIQSAAERVALSFDNKIVDCLELVRKKLYLPKYKLSNVVDALELGDFNAHRALADALMTAKVLLKINEI